METRNASAANEARIIRTQLLWILAVLVFIGLGWAGWWWGQDTGWGNPERAVAGKMARGEKAFIAGRLEEAADLYQSVVDRYPKSGQLPQALTQLATVYQQLGRLKDALDVLNRLIVAIDGQSDKADLHAYTLLQVGKVRKDMGDYPGALDAYQTVRTRHPKTDWSGEAQSGIGEVMEAQGKYKDARQAYEVLVKEMPGGFLAAEAQTSIGSCYEQEKNPKAALKAYQTVLDKYPSVVWDTAKARVDALKKQLETAGGKSSHRG